MTNHAFNLSRALKLYPDHSTHILREMERVKQLRAECGCSMGAKFMLASFGVVGVYFVLFGEFFFPNVLVDILFALLFIMVLSAVGKMIGIGLAKLRLAQLYKSLQARYPLGGG